MANRNWPSSRIFNMHLLPSLVDVSVAIGASGAPSIIAGSGLGIKSITRLSAGVYQLQMQDNYAKLLQLDAMFHSPPTGSAVNAGSFITGTIYRIITLGTTTQAQWVAAGVPSGITAAVGVVFKAAGAGAGNGTVKPLGDSGIAKVEIAGNPQVMLNNQPFVNPNGCYITIQTLQAQMPAATTQATPIQYAAADPTNGCVMILRILMNSSSVQ